MSAAGAKRKRAEDSGQKAAAAASGEGDSDADEEQTRLLHAVTAVRAAAKKSVVVDAPPPRPEICAVAIEGAKEQYKRLKTEDGYREVMAETESRRRKNLKSLATVAAKVSAAKVSASGALGRGPGAPAFHPDLLCRVFGGYTLAQTKDDKEYDILILLCGAHFDRSNPRGCIDTRNLLAATLSAANADPGVLPIGERRIFGHIVIMCAIAFSVEFRRDIEPFCQSDRFERFCEKIGYYIDVFLRGHTTDRPERVKGLDPSWTTYAAFANDMRVLYIAGALPSWTGSDDADGDIGRNRLTDTAETTAPPFKSTPVAQRGGSSNSGSGSSGSSSNGASQQRTV